MATCRDAITLALQMSGIVAVGRDPKDKEAALGLVALQSMFDEWFVGGMFGRFTDVYVTEDYTANEGERVTVDGANVTLPFTYEDRAPYDLSAVVVVTTTGADNFIYTNGAWESCTGLTLGSEAPLAGYGLDGLAGTLAERLASTFGTDVGVGAARAARLFKGAIMGKVGSTQPDRVGEYF